MPARNNLYYFIVFLFLTIPYLTFASSDCTNGLSGSGERPQFTFLKRNLRLNVGDRTEIEFLLPGLNKMGQPIRGESSTLAYGPLGFFDSYESATTNNEDLETLEIQEIRVSDDKMAIQLVARRLTQAMILDSIKEFLSPELRNVLSKKKERSGFGAEEDVPPAQIFILQLGSPFAPNHRNKIDLNITGITAQSEDETLNQELNSLFTVGAPVTEMVKFNEVGTEFKGREAKEIFDVISSAYRKIPDSEVDEWLAEIPIKFRKTASLRRYRELTASKINKSYEVTVYVSNATQLNSMLSGLYALGLDLSHPIFRLGTPYFPHVAKLLNSPQ